jgi:HK97 family phage portal protein
MGVLSRIAGAVGFKSAPQPRPFEDVIARLDGGLQSAGMMPVTSTQAMQVATVMACVRVIANGCATPKLHVFREKRDGTRELATNIPEYRLLNRRPNEWQTSFEFRRMMTMHAALTGNAVAVKVRVGNRVRELIPVRPGFFDIRKVGRYLFEYRIWDEYGPVGVFGPSDVFHLPNWQWEDVEGLDALNLARNAIGLSVAAESTQASLFANGGRPAGILTTQANMSPEAIDRLRSSWAAFSANKRLGTAILDGGFKYEQIAMSGVDSQHLETRRFQVEEICRAFDVFPIMIGHSDKAATFASSEAFFGAHLKHTLAPWHELWIERLDEFVLDGSGPLFVEFDTRYLTSGSMKDRAVWARTMAEMGIYTRNELRDEEGKDPRPGLDDPLTPMNMNGGPAATAPQTTEDPEEGDDDDDTEAGTA